MIMPKVFSLKFASCIAGSAAALLACSTASAVVLQGNPYSPTGADFQIVGLQGIDASNPLGKSGFNTQVNTDFEFTPSIGVSYDTGAANGKLKDFGLGLYDVQNQTQSTGLRVNYAAAVDPSTVSITVEDFDIKTGAAGFNLTGKVAPTITLLGANNTVLATFGQASIFPTLVAIPDAKGKTDSDIWKINFGDLLSNAHLTVGQITGFILGADMANGEKANSDPYLLLAVGNGIVVVPEPSNFIAGIAAILFGAVFFITERRRRVGAKA